MDKQALNKKLAEWAGFTLKPCHDGCVPHWHTPRGETLSLLDNLPNFTESPDACFKWLVPNSIDTYVTFQTLKDGIEAYVRYYPNGYDNGLVDAYAMGTTRALALCLAIEKLIDKEATK